MLTKIKVSSLLVLTLSMPYVAHAQAKPVALPTITIPPQGTEVTLRATPAAGSLKQALSEAQAYNRKNVTVKIVLAPGVYREAVNLTAGAQTTSAALVIESQQAGEAVISGSDIWDGWQPEADGVFSHAWPYRWGVGAYPRNWKEAGVKLPPIVLRREMVFINGELLEPVQEREQLKEQSFWVDETAGRVLIRPRAGTDVVHSVVEVATRAGLMSVNGRTNLTLRGLTFKHDNAPLTDQKDAVTITDCRNVLIEDCHFDWNGHGGCNIAGSGDVTVRRCTANHNGFEGLGAWRVQNLAFEDCEANFNNWRGALGNFTGWAPAGIKVLDAHGAVFRNLVCNENAARGFWLDSYCSDALLEKSRLQNNRNDGCFFEANHGPLTMRDCTVTGNAGAGLFTTTSMDVTLEHNTIADNRGGQIKMNVVNERKVKGDDGVEVMTRVERWAVRDNIIVSTTAAPLFDTPAWNWFLTSFQSGRNLWSAPGTKPFVLDHIAVGFDDWQAITGQDGDSLQAPPRFVDAAQGDYSLRQDSPFHDAAHWTRRNIPAEGMKLLSERMRVELQHSDDEAFPLAASATEAKWMPLKINALANRAFGGDDGWLGPNLALQYLPGGRRSIHGVPFDVLDNTANAPAAIALKSARFATSGGKELASEVTIPIDGNAKAVYLLQGAGYVSNNITFGEYRLEYADGTSHSVPMVSFGSIKDADLMQPAQDAATIQDWWPTNPVLKNQNVLPVMVVDRDNPLGYLRYLYALQIVNPHPEKAVRDLRIVTDPKQDATLFVLGVTALKGEATP